MFTESMIQTYTQAETFRQGLGIPRGAEIQCSFLAQGEYHRNYRFLHPVTGQALVLRVNFGSQMHLERQIAYEFETLRLLEPSRRTPKALLVDEEGICGHGALVMEYLEGRPLDYDLDLKKAAACLADVHSVPVPADSHLLSGGNTAAEILAECRQMFQVYRQSPLSEPYKTAWIDELLDKGEAGAKSPLMTDYTPCCINTELNNTNFLVDDESGLARLIDWEKPLYGDPAQDLGHFLAPTTTFWKTDVILSRSQMDRFIDDYIEAAHGPVDGERLKDRVNILAPVTCLRGITWCAMAWIEYQQPDRQLRNASTFEKLGRYLEDSFLQMVEEQLAALDA